MSVLSACAEGESAARPDAGLPSEPVDAATCEPCEDCVEAIPVQSANHLTGDIDYPDPPPAGGDHNPCWAEWGVHDEVVPPERWVHNLEHGGVVFLYGCAPDCAEDVEVLTALTESLPRTLLTAYPGLPTRFAAVAWGQRLQTDCVHPRELLAFYEAHFDHAPESLSNPPPASCE